MLPTFSARDVYRNGILLSKSRASIAECIVPAVEGKPPNSFPICRRRAARSSGRLFHIHIWAYVVLGKSEFSILAQVGEPALAGPLNISKTPPHCCRGVSCFFGRSLPFDFSQGQDDATRRLPAVSTAIVAAAESAATGCPWLHRPCFVHGERSPFELFAVPHLDGLLSFLISCHFDEAEPL